MTISQSIFSQFCEFCVDFTGNVAIGVAIGVGGFAAGIGMVAFAEAQVSVFLGVVLSIVVDGIFHISRLFQS